MRLLAGLPLDLSGCMLVKHISIPVGAIIRIVCREQDVSSGISIPVGAIISFTELKAVLSLIISIPVGAIIRYTRATDLTAASKFQFQLVRLLENL